MVSVETYSLMFTVITLQIVEFIVLNEYIGLNFLTKTKLSSNTQSLNVMAFNL